MFRRSPRPTVISPNLREIERRLRALEGQLHRRIDRLGSRTSGEAALAAEGIGEAIAQALGGIAERFRGNAASVGSEAANIGDQAVRRLAAEVENRPLITLALAVGIGVLVGLSLPRR
jgi:hypothetical protein